MNFAYTWNSEQAFWICAFHTCTPRFHLVAAAVMETGEGQMPIYRKGGRWPQDSEGGVIVMYLHLEQSYGGERGFRCTIFFMVDLSGIMGV